LGDYALKTVATVARIAAVALVSAALTPAVAAGPADVMRTFGLAGTWSQNCAVPEGTLGASRITFDTSSDRAASFTSTFTTPIPGNPQATTIFEIREATLLPDRQIRLVGRTTKLSRSDGQITSPPDSSLRQMIIQKVDAKFRIMDNRLLDGTAIAVEAGLVRATGASTPLLSKCARVGTESRPPRAVTSQNALNVSPPPVRPSGALPGQLLSPIDYLLRRLYPNMTLDAYLKRIRGEFRMADANADGEISKSDAELLAQIRRASFRAMYLVQFFQADLDGDGVVTEDELRRWFRYGFYSKEVRPATGKTVEQTIEDKVHENMVADANHDGRITFAEALSYANLLPDIGALAAAPVYQLLAFAPAGKSALTKADLDAAAEKLFHEVDANGDGVVSAEELRAYRASHNGSGPR
jgi:Ca2+-binding EF-hand superfamily protein